MNELKQGDPAPDFSAPSSRGGELKLSSLKGKNVVLYFYPKDDTPGCTIEANEFTATIGKFAAADTVVLGVSVDDLSCHADFIRKYTLKIDLLADPDQKIARAFGSAGEKYAKRDTILIGKDGRVKKIYRAVNPRGHAEQVLADLKS